MFDVFVAAATSAEQMYEAACSRASAVLNREHEDIFLEIMKMQTNVWYTTTFKKIPLFKDTTLEGA